MARADGKKAKVTYCQSMKVSTTMIKKKVMAFSSGLQAIYMKGNSRMTKDITRVR